MNDESIINDDNITNQNIIQEQTVKREVVYNKMENVTNSTYFYTVQKCITGYLNDVYTLSKIDTQENKRKVYNQLSEKYIEKNNITFENLNKYIEINNDNMFINIVEMLQFNIENNNIIRYVLKGRFLNEKEEIYYSNFIVYLDYSNLTYAIEPVDSNITDLSKIDISSNIEEILENENNKYQYNVISTRDLLYNYLKNFGNMCLQMPEIAYEYLDDECKNEKFKNIEAFKEYVSQNEYSLKYIELNSYQEDDNEEFKTYNCEDITGNHYLIKETAIMQFKIYIL